MTENSIVPFNDLTAIQVYSGDGMRETLDRIHAHVDGLVADVSTADGRQVLRSAAANISKAKVRLDNLGKELTAEQKATIDRVNKDRRDMRAELDELRDEVRLPLTEYEDREKLRIARIREAIEKYSEAESRDLSLDEMRAALQCLMADKLEGFDEFLDEANAARARAIESQQARIIIAENEERKQAEQAEKDRLARAERDEEIRREAADTARREAQQEAQRAADEERNRAERERLKAITEKQAAIDAKNAAENAQRNAEQRQRDSEARGKRAAQDAKDKAESERLQAVEDERQRVADKARQVAEDKAEREADKAHRRAVNSNAVAQLIATAGLSHAEAKAVVVAIVSGKIDCVTLEY